MNLTLEIIVEIVLKIYYYFLQVLKVVLNLKNKYSLCTRIRSLVLRRRRRLDNLGGVGLSA